MRATKNAHNCARPKNDKNPRTMRPGTWYTWFASGILGILRLAAFWACFSLQVNVGKYISLIDGMGTGLYWNQFPTQDASGK